MDDQQHQASDMSLTKFELENVAETSATLLGLEDWTDYQQSVANVAGQLTEHSARVYRSEAKLFAVWLYEQNYQMITREAIIAYHQQLRMYKPNTAARKWSVVKQIVSEHVLRHELARNPTQGIKGFAKKESFKHIALTEDEARALLAQPDQTTKMGMRDYAMLRLLIRLALRRSECAKLTIGDIGMRQGHHLLHIRQSKEEKDRLLKLPVDVWRTLIDYQEALGNVNVPFHEDGRRLYEQFVWQVEPAHPLFVSFDKGDRPTHQGISGDTVYRLVRTYAKCAKIEKLTAHSLRATGITLMLEKDAPLWMVQDLAGHADPRTTRLYQKRKVQLDKSAADVLDI